MNEQPSIEREDMPHLHPYIFDRDPVMADVVAQVAAIPPNASYKRLDDEELSLARSQPIMPEGADRENAELHLHWRRWRIAGRNTFIIGPQTTARIMERVKAGDVPTAPVPPAYLEFEESPINFGASRPLGGAFISRGVVGRITFLTGNLEGITSAGEMATTVYLPSVFGDRELDHLRKGMTATRNAGGVSKNAMALAREMSGLPVGMEADWIENSAMHLDVLGGIARSRPGEPQMDISAALYDRVYGKPEHRPNPLLPKAARIVLVAADEARQADRAYAEPQYLNDDMMQRNWLEDQDQPVTLRDDVVHLP